MSYMVDDEEKAKQNREMVATGSNAERYKHGTDNGVYYLQGGVVKITEKEVFNGRETD